MAFRRKIYFDLSPFEIDGRQYHGGSEYALTALKFLLGNQSDFDIRLFSFNTGASRPRVDKVLERAKLKVCEGDELIKNIDNEALVFSALPSRQTSILARNYKCVFVCHGLRSIECPVDLSEILLTSSFRDIYKFFGKFLFRAIYLRRKKKELRSIFPIENNNLTIILPSFWSRASFKANFSNLKCALVVFPPPLTDLTKLGLASRSPRAKRTPSRNKIIFLSADRWIKNVMSYLIFLGKYQKRLGGLEICYTGKLPVIARFVLRKYNVSELGDLPTTQLSELLKSCRFLIYPSLNEGFGYPVIEGISHGVTVFTSGVSALGEHSFAQLKFFNGKEDLLIKLTDPGYFVEPASSQKNIEELELVFENNFRALLCGA